MKLPLFLFFLLLISFFAAAQDHRGSIAGSLRDSATGQPLSLATLTVFRAADTSIVAFRMSDPRGAFRVPGLPADTDLRLVVSFSGYATIRKSVRLEGANRALTVGELLMTRQADELEEVVVTAERPPVIVRNDTIEFNAASFKTLPNALVEDLLRKLPGVQVDGSGAITVNGRPVNRILVDGKTFFGDDPQMATKNLPADFIDKVQVTDDQEEKNRSIDNNLSDIGKVINLTLKKGVKKGWFGKAYAGAGTRDRYEAGGIGNIFRDTLQLSLVGFSNNVNQSSFTARDVQDMGGFNRSGLNSMAMSSRPGAVGLSINGISFGGMENGITRTSGAGFNLNHAPNARQSFFAQYFYGHNRSILEEDINNQQFIQDSIINTHSLSNAVNRNANHMMAAGFRLKPDSLTDINMRAGFTLTDNNRNSFSEVLTTSDKTGPLSTGNGQNLNELSGKNYNHNLTVNRRWARKKGRTLDVMHNFSYNRNANSYLTEQTNTFFSPAPAVVLFEQLRVERMPNLIGGITANFTEPLTKQLSVRVSQHLEYIRDQQSLETFRRPQPSGDYKDRVDDLSNGSVREQQRSLSTIALNYRWKMVTFSAGANALWQDIGNRFDRQQQPVDFRLFDLMPTFRISWKSFSANYFENVTAPTLSYIQPVPDNINPLNIRLGNPLLQPSKQRQINLNGFQMFPKSSLNISAYVYGALIDNGVATERTINDSGVQVSRPINVDGNRNLMANLSIGKEFRNNTRFIFSTNVFVYADLSRQALIVNGNSGFSSNRSISPSIRFGLNWNDVVEIRPQYHIFLSETRYTIDAFENLNVPTHNFNSELIVRWPKKMIWESNIFYRTNAQVAPGMPASNLLWTAAFTRLLLKDDRGLLKLSVYDILNRNNSFSRSARENFIIDQRSNILQRYFMLTFTYNIRPGTRPEKQGGRERLFMF